ncbi:MAG: polyribonucleotide nucleotidyltransferase, partial [Aquificota bacterium]
MDNTPYNVEVVEAPIGNSKISIETGYFAKQASGAVIVKQGETQVFVAAVVSPESQPDIDFLPLTVEYREKTYAYGKIPGGFVKREGKPSNREILVSRLIDRPIRPLFPKGFHNDIIITAMTLSADDKYDPDVLAIIGASAALTISEAPFEGPIAGVRVGRIDDKFIINPSYEERDKSDLDIVVAGTKDAIVMVEGGSKEVPEDTVLEAIMFGHEYIKNLIDFQLELQKKVGKEKIKVEKSEIEEKLKQDFQKYKEEIINAFSIQDKKERNRTIDGIFQKAIEELEIPEEYQTKAGFVFKEFVSNVMRE